MEGYDISHNDVGWYIYSWDDGMWLSRVDDICVDGLGAQNSSWDGYYSTEAEAKERLQKFKQGISVKKVIQIGGE